MFVVVFGNSGGRLRQLVAGTGDTCAAGGLPGVRAPVERLRLASASSCQRNQHKTEALAEKVPCGHPCNVPQRAVVVPFVFRVGLFSELSGQQRVGDAAAAGGAPRPDDAGKPLTERWASPRQAGDSASRSG